jgi:predicted outer membrane repeat protein
MAMADSGGTSELTIVNSSFSENYAFLQGGGIYAETAMLTVANSILWLNRDSQGTSTDTPAQVFVGTNPSVSVTYSCVQDTDAYDGSIPFGGAASNNIDDDPMIWPPNLQLDFNSPCVDAGDNLAVPPDRADLDENGDTTERTPRDRLLWNNRFYDFFTVEPDPGRPDPTDYPYVVYMGAYELSDEYQPPD